MSTTLKTQAANGRAPWNRPVPMSQDRTHPSYQLARGMSIPLASGGRKRDIPPQP